jgi:(2S)-methylsuccinyl-CoA dehydrogenase
MHIIFPKLEKYQRLILKKMDRKNEYHLHGYAWFETYVEAIKQLVYWYKDLESPSELDTLIYEVGVNEYVSDLRDGISMSQTEKFRLDEIGFEKFDLVRDFKVYDYNDKKRKISHLLSQGQKPSYGFKDEALHIVQEQFQKFTEEEIKPEAHEWHLKNDLIPDDVLDKMNGMGVSAIGIPEKYDGLAMTKEAMCVITEELSRGLLTAGSIGTRAEICGELINLGGTEQQKEKYLSKIAKGECLTAAVFTEPNTGSDLANLNTRAVKDGDDYIITGNKTWTTHGVRSDLFTVLARTGEPGYKQLMETFEGARIQTAARAVGVSQSALDECLQYSIDRTQFGKKIIDFDRIAFKIAMMAVHTVTARSITMFSAKKKDEGIRCDIEAGMAKLLAARNAWIVADDSLQVHGGNGYALEYPISRILCDARILNIFEGAAEIQSLIVAKNLLKNEEK